MRGSVHHTFHRLLKCLDLRSSLPRRTLSTSVPLSHQEIVIPKRIQRSPTDILQALASTIKRDTSGPHYKHHDDPYLTPASNSLKRMYSLSKESGRKAARWIRDSNPQLFLHTPDDPHIKAFAPTIRYTEDDASEAVLRELVRQNEVSDAITMYHICKDKSIDLSDEAKQELLELVCYSNGEDQLEEDWLEERWHRQTTTTIRKTWNDDGVAEELFQSLSEKKSAAYCALIRGMTQYYQVDRAWQLYKECQEEELPLDTNTYNSLIRVSSFLRDASDLRWQLVKELLATMAESGVQPNLGTLNSTLEALTQVAGWREARGLSLQVLREFTQAGIEPSLATYYFLLLIHCRERGPVSHILLDILDHLQGRAFQARHLKDTYFFVTAMNIARNHIQNLEAARHVDDLLHTDNNYCLIGDSYRESVYYRHYFALMCSQMPIDQFMEVYSDLSPHIYTPERDVMEMILKFTTLHNALQYIPQLYSDMVAYNLGNQEKLLTLVLSAAAQHQSADDNIELTEKMGRVAEDIWTRVEELMQDKTRINRITWTGQMLGDVLTCLVVSGNYMLCQVVLKDATLKAHTILGYIPPPALRVMLDAAIQRKDGDTGLEVVKYALESGHHETGELALHLRSSLNLTPRQKAKLTTALGTDIMTEAASSDSDSEGCQP
ncbi:hypothetical protein Pmani_034231 [Petrolisthes manimaculis]|uniref:Small ribosomal subunit protein mS39 n=1 Tax=Petrolisthes manimaculis TaxID=1843537 RepID=A0AAE1TPC3_9EUCA|nr:hypothetical protein Pmani_034231 [Petrolisthes manimaculis]